VPETPHREHLLKIGVSGVRGVVGEFFTPAIASAFAQAFGTYVGGGRVVVGRDTRASGEMLTHAVTCGLLASGCDVVHVGVIPTPSLQVYVAATQARGGLAITASHNPAEYNAVKLFNSLGLFFNTYERSELLDLYHQRSFVESTNAEIHDAVVERSDPTRFHLDRVLAQINLPRVRARRFRVALDAVNGAGAVVSPGFLETDLGCELHAMSIDPTKPFPRVPEPRRDTLGKLAELVADTRAEIGFAQDPDGDRLAVVDERGHVLDNDDVLALAVDAVLRRIPGDVVVNLTTSSVIDDVAKAHGRRAHRTAVGEANVVEMMQAVDAAIGGEGSNGGIIVPAVHLCRDSYVGMALLLDRLAETGETISALAGALPRYSRRLGTVPFEHGRLGQMMQALEEAFPGSTADRTDGLKIALTGGWIHVRASNTEPIMRLAVETRGQADTDALYRRVLQLLG
jgi:phosphomannomutase